MSRPDPLHEFLPETPSTIAPGVAPIPRRREKPVVRTRPVAQAIDLELWRATQAKPAPKEQPQRWASLTNAFSAKRVTDLQVPVVPFVFGIALGAVVVWLTSSTRPAVVGMEGPSGRIESREPAPVSAPVATPQPAKVTPAPAAPELTVATVKTAAAEPAKAVVPVVKTAAAAPAKIAAPPPAKPVTPVLAKTASATQVKTVDPSTPATFRGSLTVASNPEGAHVFVNGVDVGTTPLTLGDVPAGSRVVLLKLEGYQPHSSGVRIVAEQQTKISVALAPSR